MEKWCPWGKVPRRGSELPNTESVQHLKRGKGIITTTNYRIPPKNGGARATRGPRNVEINGPEPQIVEARGYEDLGKGG